ncbi:site-specific integrase [Herbaspirillum sp. RV1423]|uniref:site-specific integrase n=1 Tax=Herbaspirillum sp. RV1423 TaxID=1443993 RepID=UPI0004B45C3F|nr:site-specific integrase [Herbaspirillum sp. RV1423]
MGFEVRSITKRDGGRFHLLFHEQPYAPVRLPFQYMTLTGQQKYTDGSCSVMCRVLKDLYTYCYCIADIDLETQLLSGKTMTADQIVGFASWLRLGRKLPTNVVARIGMAEEDDDILAHGTFSTYLHFVKEYLAWSALTFIPENRHFRDVEKTFDDVKSRLEAVFRNFQIKAKKPKHTKGLDRNQKRKLLSVADPASPLNPFKGEVTRYRNWMIIKLLLATGMRRAEILCSYTEDAPDFRFGNKWKVVRRNPIPEDRRKPLPKIKTEEREIALTEAESEMVKKYKDKYRWVYKKDASGKVTKSKPSHPFFLISTQGGTPLSLDSINKMLKEYKDAAFHDVDIELHPHILRNTFCNEYLEEAIDIRGEDVTLAVDNLRRVCGWSSKSEMPALYAAKWHRKKSDDVNVERLKREHREAQQGVKHGK